MLTEYFCATCGYTELDQHGRCEKCGSENVKYQPVQTDIPTLERLATR